MIKKFPSNKIGLIFYNKKKEVLRSILKRKNLFWVSFFKVIPSWKHHWRKIKYKKIKLKMQSLNIELFSRMFLLNLAKSFKIDESFFLISDQASPSSSSHAALEPPTPPRTPTSASSNHQLKSAMKGYNNNNDDTKENLEENLRRKASSTKRENDFEDCLQKSSHFNDDSNFSDDDRGGCESVVSGSMVANGADESDHEESDCASSFDSSKLSMKQIENFLDKSPMVKWIMIFEELYSIKFISPPQSFYNPMMHLTTLSQNDQAEKQLIGRHLIKSSSELCCNYTKLNLVHPVKRPKHLVKSLKLCVFYSKQKVNNFHKLLLYEHYFPHTAIGHLIFVCHLILWCLSS